MNDRTSIRAAIDGTAAAHAETKYPLSPETGGSVSFAEPCEHSTLLSRVLNKTGLERGDIVAFLIDNFACSSDPFGGIARFFPGCIDFMEAS
jgi:hypothetical protein